MTIKCINCGHTFRAGPGGNPIYVAGLKTERDQATGARVVRCPKCGSKIAIGRKGTIFFGSGQMPRRAQLLSMGCFMVGLVTSIIGVVPYDATIHLDRPQAIADYKTKATETTRRLMYVTAVLMVAGLAIAFIGVGVQVLFP